MSRIALSFANASCAHCVQVVTRRLGETDGVRLVEVDRFGKRVRVDFDCTRVSAEAIRSVMERSGYPTRLVDDTPPTPAKDGPLTRAA